MLEGVLGIVGIGLGIFLVSVVLDKVAKQMEKDHHCCGGCCHNDEEHECCGKCKEDKEDE